MSKEKKVNPKKIKRGKRGSYEPKLAINATFAEVIKIAVKPKDEKKIAKSD